MRLTKRVLFILAAMTVATPGIAAAGLPDFAQQLGTCIKPIPDAVRNPLNQEIAARIRSPLLLPETRKALWAAVTALDDRAHAASAECRKTVVAAGATSIPVMAEMLLSQDETIRNNAITALGYLQPPSRRGMTEAPADQTLRIMLFRVGILDKSPQVRRSAIRYLARIGYANARNIPAGVMEGIDSAMDDPDPRLKRIAQTEKEALLVASEVARSRPDGEQGIASATSASLTASEQ